MGKQRFKSRMFLSPRPGPGFSGTLPTTDVVGHYRSQLHSLELFGIQLLRLATAARFATAQQPEGGLNPAALLNARLSLPIIFWS